MTAASIRSFGALLPALGVAAFLLSTLLAFAARCALFGRPRTPAVEQRPPSILAKWLQEWWIWLWGPVERACLHLGVTPNAITVASMVVVGVAGGFVAAGFVSLGGWLYLFGASLDLVDGRVARATGQASRAGAFLDSTLDRVAELLFFGGLAIAYRASAFLVAVLATASASVMVSYTRARGESLGVKDAALTGGMQRPERIFIAGTACALSPVASWLAGPGAGSTLVGAALTVLAVLTSITAARRGLAIFRALAAPQAAPRSEAVPPAALPLLRPGRGRMIR